MRNRTICALASMTVALALTSAGTLAESRRQAGDGWHSPDYGRFDLPHAPLKDCTRLAGRYGYYGNPWCNETEQRRWDRWEARRLDRHRKFD